jgi:hypothetical protein
MNSRIAEIETVGKLLEDYAGKGVFRGFSRGTISGSKATFRAIWHRNQAFDLVYDQRKGTLRFACVLPQLPSRSPMYRDFKTWLKSRSDELLPEHRRVDRARAEVKPYNRGGDVALTLKILDGDIEYGVRKLIHLVHEIYLDFLSDGRYHEWLVDTFDLDPDNP